MRLIVTGWLLLAGLLPAMAQQRAKAPKEISDSALLTLVQQRTFDYFWKFAHPVSGLAPERTTTPETVTIGGSGFGVMSILVGIERHFITREQGVDRLLKIVNFLLKANHYHGIWPHWMNGATGQTIPFGRKRRWRRPGRICVYVPGTFMRAPVLHRR